MQELFFNKDYRSLIFNVHSYYKKAVMVVSERTDNFF